MKKSVKTIIVIFSVLAATVAIAIIPFPESAPQQGGDNSALFRYYRLGGWEDNDLRITIFKNGSVSTIAWWFKTNTVQLSPDQLQTLTQWIESKQYTLKKSSLLSRLMKQNDPLSIRQTYLINDSGKMRVVNENKYLSEIISQINEIAQKSEKTQIDN